MQILIQLSLSLVGGLLMSRLAKRLNLPAVTAYLITGLLLGPYCLGGLNLLELGREHIRVSNMLPAIFLPILYVPLAAFLTGLF